VPTDVDGRGGRDGDDAEEANSQRLWTVRKGCCDGGGRRGEGRTCSVEGRRGCGGGISGGREVAATVQMCGRTWAATRMSLG
jgi:hypothetical protein